MQETDKSGLLDAILASAKDYAIIIISLRGEIETWNAGAENIFGYRAPEILGKSLDVLFTLEDREKQVPQNELDAARTKGRAWDVRWHVRKDGSQFWADGVMQPMYAPDGALAGYVKILRDATETYEYQKEIARLARVDPLTGLANRAEFNDRFRDLTASASRHGEWLILQLIDLDHFKQVNDRHGHHVGDLLLQRVAERLRASVRETDFVARLGGDEFVVLQPGADAPETGGVMAGKLLAALAQPFALDGLDIRIGASIGISVYPQDAADPEHLLRKADLALYKVKDDARNGYHYFSKDLDEQAYKLSRELTGLRRAVANHAFFLVYQPKVDTASGQVVATEALLRCREPALADCPVEHIIELAKDAGLMPQLGMWVLSQACEQTRRWHEAGLTQLKVCINLGVSEMAGAEFPAKVCDVLAGCGLAPGYLVVEITERELFDSGQTGQAMLADLRARGIGVAIDDFGTGYSSLSYLNDLPVDAIKLDKSFLRHVPDSPQDTMVAASIISLAHGLDLAVVAEGVETAEHVAFCRREHSDMMQGYFFSPPLPAAEMTPWLLERAQASVLPPPQALQPQPPQPPQRPPGH